MMPGFDRCERGLTPSDAIIKITATAICGSDLHLLDGYLPTMEAGDIMDNEPVGIADRLNPSEDTTAHSRNPAVQRRAIQLHDAARLVHSAE